MKSDQCIYCWIPLALITAVMVISLLKNISYYLKEKKQKGKTREVYQKSRSDEFYSEECPIYDNLNPYPLDILNESCYEQMNAQVQPHISTSVGQQTPECQMCYASLDHSIKRKNKKLQKKKHPPLEVDKDHHTGRSLMPSDTCIYINSAQLNAENRLSKDATQEESFDIFELSPTADDALF